MARAKSSRGLGGLLFLGGGLALVVSLLPKGNLAPEPTPAANAVSAKPADQPSWWQTVPASESTSWQTERPPEVDVRRTLDSASSRLFEGLSEYVVQTASDVLEPPPPTSPAGASPQPWVRY